MKTNHHGEIHRLWTRQHKDVLLDLENTGSYRVKKQHIMQ